ncbi:hypothetical protein ACIBK9_51785 [Nonomuraea sp. NPDC050227]|uniref:hypothetical protein n=1 Tax=Nonomuraea sp. NPDC050227 TaxID=3364360 RepID=UPI00379307F7
MLGVGVGEALRIAAVIGRAFDPGLVCTVGGIPLDTFDEAVEAGLVALCPDSGGDCLIFIHDLVRESLVNDIPPLRKAALHRAVMAALSARPGTDVETIAYHAVEAGPAAYQDAIHWATAAAEQAGRRLAYQEAAAWWGRAVAAHGAATGDPEAHVELLLRQIHALLEAGDVIGARQVREEAVRAADRGRPGSGLTARALTAFGAPAIWELRDPYKAAEPWLVHHFTTALHELPDGDSPLRVLLLAGLAQELYGSGDPRGDELSARAVETARRLGDPRVLMRALNARHLAVPQPLHVPELSALADELHDLAVTARAPGYELLAQMMRTHYRLDLFDVAGADRAAAGCERLLERRPLPWPRFQHTMWRAGRLVLDGRFDAAEELYAEAGRQAQRVGMWYAEGVVVAGRLMLSWCEGTIAGAGRLIDTITGIHPSLDHDARVLQLCAAGHVGEARALAAGGWPSPPSDWSWLAMTCLQGAAQAAVGDVPACRDTYARMSPYGGRLVAGAGIAGLGPVDWYLALLASALGDHEGAAAHLSVLAEQAELNGLTWWRDRARAVASTGVPGLPLGATCR